MMPDRFRPLFADASAMEDQIAELIVDLMRDAYAHDVTNDDIVNGVAAALVHLAGEMVPPAGYLRALAGRLEAGPLHRCPDQAVH